MTRVIAQMSAADGRRGRGPLGRGAAVPGAGVRGDRPAAPDAGAQGRHELHVRHRRVAEAVARAKKAAGGRDVAVAGGGTLLRRVLKEGLLDELELHIVPVVLGTGMRLLDADLDLDLDDKQAIELTPVRVVHTPEVTHVRYRVEGRAPLVLDDRGSGGS